MYDVWQTSLNDSLSRLTWFLRTSPSKVSVSVTDNAMYIFRAILLKIQWSLNEFKRLYLLSRLHHFGSFFSKFSRRPPNPHQREGTPHPHPPHSALRASRPPPPVHLWIRHCFICGHRRVAVVRYPLSDDWSCSCSRLHCVHSRMKYHGKCRRRNTKLWQVVDQLCIVRKSTWLNSNL